MKVKLERGHWHEGKFHEQGETIEIGDDPDRLEWLVNQGVVAANAPAAHDQGKKEKQK